jgi:DNA-directed RNA polymerase subunit RPC12/RpoP
MTAIVKCKNCGEILAESSSIAPDQRKPCSSCGSKSRFYERELTEVLKLTDDMRWWVRQRAAIVLGEIGDTTAVPTLIEMLRDVDQDVHESVAKALGRIGKPGMSALIEAAMNEEFYVHKKASSALTMIGEPAVHALMEAFSNDVWIACKCATRQLIERVNSAVFALTQALRDNQESVSPRTIQVLQKVVPDALDADYLDSIDARLSKGNICTANTNNEIEITLTSAARRKSLTGYCGIGFYPR